MPSKFKQGVKAYAKDGKAYVVDEVADGLVYCTAPGGAEAEFGESQLMTEAEWSARSDNRRGNLYTKLKQARAFAPYKGPLDAAGSAQFLNKTEKLFPGLLDFTAFTVAARVLTEIGYGDLIPELSIVKCRAIFDEASAQTRVGLVAEMVAAPADRLVSASQLGDNMARAMIDKGLNAAAFEMFGMRRRQ